MSDTNPFPAAFIATEEIKVDGKPLPVREIERSQTYHSRVLAGADGSIYLEYPVSVGPFKIEISVIHVLSREELTARAAGTLDLGNFSATLSEIAQNSNKFERKDLAPVGHAAYAEGLGALLHLLYMEGAVLDKVGETDSDPMIRAAAAGCASDVKKWVGEMSADRKLSDPAALTKQARTWAIKLSSLERLIDFTCNSNPHNAAKEAIEKAIYEVSMQLYEMQPPATPD